MDARRLQRHLREGHRRQANAARVGPYTCFMHPATSHDALNLAIPDEPAEGRRVPIMGEEGSGLGAVADDDPAYALVMVKAHFAANRRTPRVEFLAECQPDLFEDLAAAGFVEEARAPLLACTPETWRSVPNEAGLRIEPLFPETPWETTRHYLDVQREAYGLDVPVPERAPPDHWDALQIGAGLLLSEGDEAVAAGGFTPLDDGLCDVRGVAVRPAYRGRRIGVFLLSALARVAHQAGAEAVLALPDGADSVRFAGRAGFEPVATLVSFRAEGAAAP